MVKQFLETHYAKGEDVRKFSDKLIKFGESAGWT